MTTKIDPIPDMPVGETLRYRAEAAAFFTMIGFFRLFGADTASALGGWLGRNVFYRSGTSNRARTNLGHAYPEKTQAEREAIIVEMWDNLGRTVAEYAHLGSFSIKGDKPRLEVAGTQYAEAAIASGKGVIFVSGHFANWEMMPFTAAQLGYESGEVYRPLNNPYVDRWMVRQRIANGPQEQIAKGVQGTKRIFTMLRAGKCILLLADQKTNEGLPAPFFGRDAMTTPAPAALALKLGTVVLPASNERLGGARFRMKVYPPIDFTPTGDHDRDILGLTIKITEAIEQLVREKPSQWLWIHRRWPKDGDKMRSKRAQALSGAGVRVENEGSSRT
ncbi:MAG TPA: lysophospholipid acyltransferase family protein [Rhizomicrobium sp.]|jgi:KDO2-lipid IV(A) lauroyltransferase|nr:lysophospholipid acyltransferase family protein [Rhizomicrobium sp.]